MTDSPQVIAFINETSDYSDDQIALEMAAIEEDFATNCHLWNLPPGQYVQVRRGQPIPAGAWQHVYLDNADTANALGYHDLTSEGLPLGKIFVKTTQMCGSTVSRVSSHEDWERWVDPWLNRVTPILEGREFTIEVGDLLSLDEQSRPGLGGVLLSGIALPAAYYAGYGSRYDIGGLLTQGLPDVEPSAGAYLMWLGGAGWEMKCPASLDHQKFMAMQPQIGSRRHRRMKGQANWIRSTVPVR